MLHLRDNIREAFDPDSDIPGCCGAVALTEPHADHRRNFRATYHPVTDPDLPPDESAESHELLIEEGIALPADAEPPLLDDAGSLEPDAADEPRIARLKRTVRAFPETPGVYLWKDAEGRVLYIGKSKSLKHRVSSYLTRGLPGNSVWIAEMVALAEDVEHIETGSEVEALLLENRLVKDLQPRFNTQLKDGKSYPYIGIHKSGDFPYITVTRELGQKGVTYVGPFTDVTQLRFALKHLQRVFRFRTCTFDIREGEPKNRWFRPCLLHAVRACSAPCNDRISAAAYAEDLASFRLLLQGKKTKVVADLTGRMKNAARDLRFEEAAALRDQLSAIESLNRKAIAGDFSGDERFVRDPAVALDRLAEVLALPGRQRSIVGLDMATLQGTDSVGSLVHFVDGTPFKDGYRRFKIRTVEGVNDFDMMREVVTRYFQRLVESDLSFPDLVLIDGGKGQVSAVVRAFRDAGYAPPPLVGLAKREELLILPDRADPIELPRNDPALQLLQYIRDEAHRFAQHYHLLLRKSRHFTPGGKKAKKGKRP